MKNIRNIVLRKLLGIDILEQNQNINKISNQIKDIKQSIADLNNLNLKHAEALHESAKSIMKLSELNNKLIKSQRDNLLYYQHKLSEMRRSKDYESVFANKKPLITVRIASYNKTQALVDQAIKSVLRQTYQNFEIIIINDGPNHKTRQEISKIDDSRIRYYELPQRSTYPESDKQRWMVAGSPGMNLGVTLAKGAWIAPLDDDDEFSADHLESLLSAALNNKAEVTYGMLEKVNTTTGIVEKIWSNPPERGGFSFQGALYMRSLSFFEYDLQSWIVDEPGDWNLCRRMVQAGVLFYAIEQNVGKMYHTPISERIDHKIIEEKHSL